MNKLSIPMAVAAAFALAGCTTTGGLTDSGSQLIEAITAPGNPDPDNKAYLDACVKQFEEQRKAEESNSRAITTALTSTTDASTKASLVMLMAVKTMQAAPFRCSLERRRGFMETLTADGLINGALGAYGINRMSNYQKRSLQSGDFRYELQMQDNADSRQQINDLAGTKPDLGYASRKEADSAAYAAQKDADAAFISATPAPAVAP